MPNRDFLLKHISNEAQMLQWAEKLSRVIGSRAVIFLYGNLGAGKTTLVRGFLRGLGYKGPVKSPTYTLVENYHLNENDIFHFDLYRIRDAEELDYIGIADYFHKTAVCLIEWPENGMGLLPSPDLSCYIEFHVLGRNIKWVAHSEEGQRVLGRLTTCK